MRILFYSDNLYPETSGISDSIVACARGLRARGHTVGFVGPKYSRHDYAVVGKTAEDPSPLDGFEVYRIPSLPYPNSPTGQSRNVIPLGWSLNFVRRFKPDILHSQSPFGTGLDALIVSKLLGIPLVGTNHTFIGEFVRVHGPIRAEWFLHLMDRFYSWYYNRCSAVSVVSPLLLDEMKMYGFRRPGTVVYNSISLETFSLPEKGEKEKFKNKFGLSGPVIICAGRVALEKKVDVVLHAFAKLVKRVPAAKLVIAGGGSAEKLIHEEVRKEGLSDSVICTGHLDHLTLGTWYKAADVFVIASPIETQGLALMQAFAAGLPAVGVSAGAVGEHIQPEWGYTVPEGDTDALADRLADMIAKGPASLAAMGEKARLYVERFSEASISGQWQSIYESVLGEEQSIISLPKVSVVIPAYNEEVVIAATLRAVTEQNYPDYEVIVVDNASTDATAEIARSFVRGAGSASAGPVVKIVHEPKKGLLHARERGRKEAVGEIIVQMDADCLPESGWLSRGVARFTDRRIVGVAGPYDYFDGRPFFRFFSLFSQKYIYKGMSIFVQALRMGAVLIGGNSFIRASALEKAGGYNTSLTFYGEDTDTAKRVSRFGKVVFDGRLVQQTSARRFKAEGTFKITALYLFHFFKVIYKGKRNKRA